ncbi:hypothetical protein Pint_19213 [Pistacia integerrima]|uniref:Uncharacterized protein n=1 Tax=Pistacia integerrima TaxID=434235 RepID=A0ACC0YWL9_9ROSI|nr:hypothetical protein Pint_19213 [Pistacia integerrima]
MKKWSGGICIGSLFMLLVMRYSVLKNPIGESSLSIPSAANTISPLSFPIAFNTSSPLELHQDGVPPTAQPPESANQHLINYSQGLPNAVVAVKEARVAWENLMDSFVKEQNGDLNNSSGSSITVIGIPNGLLGDFRIDLTGESLPGEPDPPIILHYNVRLQGDKITDDSVIVQNTWTAADDWGEEERCPSPIPGDIKKVDELNQCNELVGNNDARKAMESGSPSISVRSSVARNRSGSSQHFPFKQGYLSVMTLRVGEEGIQMTVDGKHITSFAFRESLEPWHVSEVRISGDLELISVLASGLPTSEGLDDVVDLTALKSAPLQRHQSLDLFVGVFSTANNFRRRMAVRRAWMQYPNVKNGTVAVRFFVGLHKNQMVNEELWNEVQTYGDIQLMPFVEYYSLITWKTIAICIFGTQVVSAKYVMKTDDDAFVRVDEVLASLNRSNVSHGLLYGLINTDAHPHRSTDSKWYISPDEWPESTYPPWAHGPGYVMFKLEDVAMGIWIAELKKDGLEVTYINEQRVYNEGCQDGYVVAHYQSPREMLCLWQKLQEGNAANCCVDQ